MRVAVLIWLTAHYFFAFFVIVFSQSLKKVVHSCFSESVVPWLKPLSRKYQ